MAYQYIISKSLDPIFAISIGLAAALTRINREEKDKGRSTQQSVEVFKRRVGIAWEEGKGRVEPMMELESIWGYKEQPIVGRARAGLISFCEKERGVAHLGRDERTDTKMMRER